MKKFAVAFTFDGDSEIQLQILTATSEYMALERALGFDLKSLEAEDNEVETLIEVLIQDEGYTNIVVLEIL